MYNRSHYKEKDAARLIEYASYSNILRRRDPLTLINLRIDNLFSKVKDRERIFVTNETVMKIQYQLR